MSSNPPVLFILAGLFGVICSQAQELFTLSTAVSPRVAYQAGQSENNLRVTVEAETFGQEDVRIELGVSGGKAAVLSNENARIQRTENTVRWLFEIPADRVLRDANSWTDLRLALAVEWLAASGETARQRERFLHLGSGSTHGGLSKDPLDWAALDLEQLAREQADRALQIRVPFDQPMKGRGTVVIEDASGKRVKNLISGSAMDAGSHSLVWDGLDEAGNAVPPGDYLWRGIFHPGLKPVHLMEFCDAPGSNHATFQAAATNGQSLFFAAPVTEGGWEIIERAADGSFVRGFNPPHGHGLGRVDLVADGNFLYAAHDGMAWGFQMDRSKPGWKEERLVSVMRLDLKTWTLADFPEGIRHAEIKRYEAGPDAAMKPKDTALTGLTLWQGKMYLADRSTNEVHIIDPATGKRTDGFPLAKPIALAASASGLYAIADGKLLKLTDGKPTTITTLKGNPSHLHAAHDGRFYISDADSHVVNILDAKGSQVGMIGTPGGITPGPYDAKKLHNPAGSVLLENGLWITESERWHPKRLAAFDITTGEATQELFGPPNYGEQGAGFDDQDESLWIGLGALWRLDMKSAAAKPLTILGGKDGRRSKFHRQDGRTFVITSGKITWIQEMKKDGTLKPLACITSAHQFSYAHDWQPPSVFIEAFQRDYPNVPYNGGTDGRIEYGKPNHGFGMLWVDRDGDGAMQAEEIEFATAARSLAGAGWSHDFHDLTFRVPGEVDGKRIMVTLEPDGWWPGGAPRYPALNDAVRAGIEIDLPGNIIVESITDRAGNLIFNSDPAMRAFSPDGKLLWRYPNQWSNVHGSHRAPLPRTGELQGSLFFNGLVPLDDSSDVFLITGNHGRVFAMTSDGLYLDEMFPDVRMLKDSWASGKDILGGEAFGGTFGKSEKDGNYYFHGGGRAYRVFRIDGLREVVRSEGKIQITPAQTTASERNAVRLAATSAPAREATIPFAATPPDEPVAKWDRDGKFPVTVRASYDEKNLHLQYDVKDDSPWVNRGGDWQALFKTGDGIDLQLGPATEPQRGEPLPGDLRLFIAPMGDETIAVLYRHRAPNAPADEAVNFQSPWRSEKVNSVRRLDTAKIEVHREGQRYRIKAIIPLTELKIDITGGLKLRGDFGVIYGDAAGTVNIFRNHWSNTATGLVNDVPGEIMLTPALWGDIHFGNPSSK